MSRLPVRVRVTLAFAGVMAVVLAATGLFLYLRLGAELDATIDAGLRSRAADLVAAAGPRLSGSNLVEAEDHVAQVLDGSGRVLDATPGLEGRPLVSGPVGFTDLDRVPGGDDPVRLLATPAAGD